jgi:hypothetical protein
MKAVKWLSVESSVFDSSAYLAGKRLLYLRFRSGDVYRYFDVPAQDYAEFLASESKGTYFAHNIRDRFCYQQVHPIRSAIVLKRHGDSNGYSGSAGT